LTEWLIQPVRELFSYESEGPGGPKRHCGVAMGHTPSTKCEDYYADGTIDWIRIEDVNGKYITSTGKKLTQAGYDNCSAKMVPPNTCVMTVTKTIGRTGITTSAMAISQSVVAFIPNPDLDIDPEYLYYYLPTVFVPKVLFGAPTDIGKREIDATELVIPRDRSVQEMITHRIRREEELLAEMEELLARSMDNLRTLRLNLAVKYLPDTDGIES